MIVELCPLTKSMEGQTLAKISCKAKKSKSSQFHSVMSILDCSVISILDDLKKKE